jgi:RimJ/RimL family protein N-acetyltransferase
MNAPETTERLLFRCLREDDVENVFQVLGNPEAMRFSLSGAIAKSEIPKWLSRRLQRYAEDRPSQYAVLDRKTGEFFGFCGFLPFNDPDKEAEYEIGYRFRPSCWNRGIGTEAVRSTLAYGFTRFRLPVAVAVVERENMASVRILEKVGMEYVKDMLYHGIPVMRYVLRRQDYQQSAEIDKADEPKATF